MQALKYYLIVVSFISCGSFGSCASLNLNETESILSVEEHDTTGASTIEQPSNRNIVVKLPAKKSKGVSPEAILIVMQLVAVGLFVAAYKFRPKEPEPLEPIKRPSIEKGLTLEGILIPPVTSILYGPEGADKETKVKYAALRDKVKREVGTIMGESRQGKEDPSRVDMKSATPVYPMDASTRYAFSSLHFVRECKVTDEGRVYLFKSRINDKLYAVKVLKKIEGYEIGLENEIKLVNRFVESSGWRTKPASKRGAEVGQNLLLATFKGPIPFLGVGDDAISLIYEAKPAHLEEFLMSNRCKSVGGKGPLSMETKECLARQIVLSALHLFKVGFVHNDIRADNVLINRDGTIQFCDYGGAQVIGERETRTMISRYTSEPERVLNSKSNFNWFTYTDSRSDLYSLGSLLHYVFTNEYYSYDGNAYSASALERTYINDAALNKSIETDRLKRDGVSQEWIGIIEDLLAVRRSRRITPDQLVTKYYALLGLDKP